MAAVSPAPEQQAMGGAAGGPLVTQFFANKEQMLVKQTMRGCLQECMGCEAKSEYHVSDFSMKNLEFSWMPTVTDGTDKQFPNELYALENSSFLCRCCFRDGRPFKMGVSQFNEATANESKGKGAGGAPVVNYNKPCGFPVICELGGYPGCEDKKVTFPCCCMLPNMDTTASDGITVLNNSRYTCDPCMYVPKFMYSEGGKDIYKLRQATCCGGCCVAVKCAKGGCNVPFYFWDPATGEKILGVAEGEHEPQILKVWGGMKKECCSTADTFAVFFPKDCTPERKAGLLGMTFLIDFVVFESQGDK